LDQNHGRFDGKKHHELLVFGVPIKTKHVAQNAMVFAGYISIWPVKSLGEKSPY